MPENDDLQVVTELMAANPNQGWSLRLPGESGRSGKMLEKLPQDNLCFSEIASKLAESMSRPELSMLQVLPSLALGRSYKEIGHVLYISENTVKRHVKSILTNARCDRPNRSYCHHH